MCNNCINADHQAEKEELKKQVSALTQALETQNRENQPYIKELEARIKVANWLLMRSKFLLWPTSKPICGDIKKYLLREWTNTPLDWIPSQERLPEELTPVLGLIPEEDNEIAICLYEKKEGFYLSYESDFKPKVEFWAPIPNSLLNATGGDKPE